MRLLKILGFALAMLFALALVTVGTVILLPQEQYKSLIGSTVKSATGRDLVIDGDLGVRLGSSFKVVASGIRFSNPQWSSRPEMFACDRVEVEVVLLPLFKGVLDVRLLLQSPDLLLETDAEGRANWQMGGGKAEKTDEQVSPYDEGGVPLRPFLREVRFEQFGVAFKDGATGQEHSAEFGTILLHSQDDDVVVKVDGQVDGQPIFLEGGLLKKELGEGETPTGFDLTGNLGDIGLSARGTLTALSAEADVDLQVEASVPTLATLSAIAGRKLPDQGPLDMKARISGGGGEYRVSDIRADLGAEKFKATVTGSVADLSRLDGIDLSVTANTERLAEVVALAGVEVPVELPPALRAEAMVSGDIHALSVSSIRVDAEDGDIKVIATGTVEDVMALKGVSADISVEAGSMAAFSKYAKTELPNLGPLNASATVLSSGDTFSLSNIKADLKGQNIQAHVEGKVADAVAIRGLEANVTANLASLASLNQHTDQVLPDTGPLALAGTLMSEGGLDAPSKITGSLKGDGVRASFDGSIEDLIAGKGIFFTLDLQADSVTQVARLAGQDIRHDEALKLEGDVYIGSGSYRADKLKLEVGPNQITGEATFVPPVREGGKPSLSANLHLGKIDLARYFVLVDIDGQIKGEGQTMEERAPSTAADDAPESVGPAAATATPQTASSKKKLFRSDSLPLDLLQHLDADVEITADEIATYNVIHDGVSARVTLHDGVLGVSSLQAAVGQGSLQAAAKIDASSSPARLSLDVDMRNGTTRNFGGTYSADVELKGRGDSIAQIMAGLDGRIIIDVRDLDLKKSALTQFGRSLTDSLNPFDKEEDKSKLTCAIVRLDITNGIANANDRIVAQMTRVTWFGGGTIDLKTEKIDIGAQSKPRKGLGLGMGSLASLVHVGGTLATPKIQLDPKDVAFKYGEYYLTATTGGLYLLLKGLWDGGKANSDVCAKVLELETEDAAGAEAMQESDGNAGGAAEADSAEDAAARDHDEVKPTNPAIHDLDL